MLAGWYEEGLIHPILADPPYNPSWGALLIKTGAWLENIGFASLASNFDMAAAPLPRHEGSSSIGHLIGPPYYRWRSAAVSAGSAKKTEAVRWLDIGYSHEGGLLYNFGIEGKTYNTTKNGPVLAEFALADMRERYKQQAAWAITLRKYARGMAGGPYVLSGDLFGQYYAAVGSPLGTTSDWLPQETYVYPEALMIYRQYFESAGELRAIMEDIWQYQLANFIAFVTGQRPLDEFPQFVQTIEKMGIEKATEILEDAWRRFYEKPIR
jgi:putative aldouronate transport system substrate-binding protein